MGSRRVWPLAGLWGACVLALVGLYLVFVRTSEGQRIDAAAIDGRRFAPARAERAADTLLGTIDTSTLALALVAIIGVALLRRRPAAALVAATTIAGAVVTTEILKSYVLPRPDLLGGVAYDNSFPSGHATIALAVGLAAVLVATPRARRRIALAAVLYAGAVGAATVALGWHRPSDVLGADLVATGWASACAALATAKGLRWTAGAGARPGAVFDRRLARSAAVLLGAGYVAAIAIAVFSRIGALQLRLIDAAHVGATFSLLAAAGLLVAALIWALERSLERPGDRGSV